MPGLQAGESILATPAFRTSMYIRAFAGPALNVGNADRILPRQQFPLHGFAQVAYRLGFGDDAANAGFARLTL